jgi:hypothetical protein
VQLVALLSEHNSAKQSGIAAAQTCILYLLKCKDVTVYYGKNKYFEESPLSSGCNSLGRQAVSIVRKRNTGKP